MRLFTIVFERLPMLWLLLGLLFISGGLYLGFDYKLTFAYLIVGGFCSMYGLLLFVFLRFERPKKSPTRTLSPNFISAGEAVAMPAAKTTEDDRKAAAADAQPSASGAQPV
jgi:hypothetical protein